MSIREGAEEHLRVIRSLMERATHYRAISAQGALVGGLLAVGTSAWMYVRDRQGRSCLHCELTMWLCILALTAAANTFFLWRDARRRGEALLSARGRWAIRALAPSFILAGALTWAVARADSPMMLGLVWSGAYALALLAASHFAPRSIAWLGRAFFVATLLFLGCPRGENQGVIFEAYMGLTFGLFHLVYAACTWPRSGADPSGHV